MAHQHKSDDGFTLVEVAIAIVILALALTTLIGYQTRLMDTYVNERNGFRATLAAQYLVTFLEIENEPPDPGDTKTELVDALRDKGYFAADSLDTKLQDSMRDWKYIQHVSSVDYGEFQDILRRVEIEVEWGPGSNERVSLVLFLNTPTTEQGTARQGST